MTAQFRIGGYYRDKSGDIVQLTPDGRARWMDEHGDWDLHGGIFCLTTGECSSARGYRYCSSDLLPGELHNVNGQWVPVAEEAPKQDESRIGDDYDEGDDWTDPPAQAYDTERVRLPLTWATPKPVDRWEGFTVRSFSDFDEMGNGNMEALNNHPLQRMTDPSDPAHGSAWLKVR